MWQLPYFTSKNALFSAAAEKGYFVKNDGGQLPAEDGILDMSNPSGAGWYEGLLSGLLKIEGRRDQGRLRRGCAARRRVRVGTHRLVRAQFVSAPLQQERRRSNEARRPATTSSGPAALGPAVSVIRSTGAATRRTPIRRWLRRCAPGCHSGSRASPIGATTPAVSSVKAAARLLSPLAAVCRPYVPHPLPRRSRRASPGNTTRLSSRISGERSS